MISNKPIQFAEVHPVQTRAPELSDTHGRPKTGSQKNEGSKTWVSKLHVKPVNLKIWTKKTFEKMDALEMIRVAILSYFSVFFFGGVAVSAA